MLRLRLKVLGGFEARIGPGEPLDIATRKTRALLAYLALPPGRAYARDKLTGLLWSDRGDVQARNSLRQALTELGRILAGIEPSPLVKGRGTLSLDPEAVEVDAMLFERLAASPDAGDLRRAAAMYAGDLLDGFGVRDPAFEEWLRDERQRYRELAIANLKTLVTCQTGANALAVAQRLLALAPLQEEVHRTVIRLHAEAGDIAAALRQYDTCCATLKRELDITPSPETEALHRRIRNQATARPDSDYIATSAKDLRQPSMTGKSKPSVAVLPFGNLSGDPEQQYFSDGITEDIITELSRFHSLFVIARHSSFQFRDTAADVRRVGRELGVRYVTEGSVRRTGDHLRITAQLIDATTGNHLWSERYDRALADIFAVQDAVVQAVVVSVAGRVTSAEIEQARRKRTESLEAYECCLRGLEYWQMNSAEANAESYRWLEKAAKLDPEYAEPLTRLSISEAVRASQDATDFEPALALAARAVALDPNNSWSHCALGIAKLSSGAVAASADHFRVALRLNPNDPDQMVWCALYHVYAGEFAAAHAVFVAAEQLNPLPPIWYKGGKAIAEYGLRHYATATELFESLVSDPRSWQPSAWIHYYLAACYERLGRALEAKSEIARALELKPDLSLRVVAVTDPYVRADDLEHLLEPLRKAGLPE